MFKLAIPIIIQNLLSAAVNSSDVIMLNYVGQSAISAVSLAANYSNILFMVYYGLGTGASLLCAQYFGKKNMQAIHAVEGIALRFSLAISALVALAAFTIPQRMLLLFTSDQELIAIGSSYIRIMGITYLCWGVTEIYLAILRSIGRVTISMALNMLAFGLNILLNAVFIFGLFGAPKLGVTGVAIATASSRLIQLIACVIVSLLSKDVKLNPIYMFIRSKTLLNDFIHLSLPALGNDLSWSVAFSMYSVILGHLGTEAVAANSLVTVVRNVGSVLAVTPFVLRFASLNDTAMHYLKYMLLINSYYIMGSAVNTALIAGVFRAGGDTKFGLICDTIDMWIYAVPLGFFAAFVVKLPVLWVYFLLCTDEFVKWPWVIHHYRKGEWAKNITREDIFE